MNLHSVFLNPQITHYYFICFFTLVILFMDLVLLNMYQRLRDFNVHSVFLDEIFNHEKDLEVLTKAWNSLKASGLSEDDTAKEIADIILDLDIFKEPKILTSIH